MAGHVFVVLGDLARLAADAIAFSTDWKLGAGGHLYASYRDHVAGFTDGLAAIRPKGTVDVGSTRWIPLEGRPRGVVVTAVTGGTAMSREERAKLAVERALACAADRLGPEGPWLVGLPAFLMGKGGAWQDRVRVIEPQLRAAQAFVEENPAFDVAFVLYTEGNHRLWQAERRRVLGAPRLGVPAPLVNALRTRQCALFVGSGVSLGSGLPSWSDLCRDLSARLVVDPPRDVDGFLDLAQWYRDAEISPAIEAVVAQRFRCDLSGSRPSLAHYLLAALPIRHFVTTNYDDLLEVAIEACGRTAQVVVDEHDVVRTSGTHGRFVVKFHGDVRRPEDGIVLSRDDYDEMFVRRPAMTALLEGLLLNHAFLFVGYSLRDPDFRQIFGRIGTMLRDARLPAFAPTFEDNAHAVRQWAAKNVHLLPIEGDTYGARSRGMLRWLDALCDATTAEGAVLASEVQASPALADLREGFLGLEPALQAACATATSADDARFLADVLLFFARWGYRGQRPGQLSAMLAEVAGRLEGDEARILLEAAMLHAEEATDVERLRDLLDAQATAGGSPMEKPR